MNEAPTTKKKRKSNAGRPSVITEKVLSKLEQGFSYDYTDEEACFYAGISPEALYAYQLKNPEFTKRKFMLKSMPVLAAKQTVAKQARKSYGNSIDYLKRKRKNEFGDALDLTSAGKQLGDNTKELDEQTLRNLTQGSNEGTRIEGASTATPLRLQ